MSNLSKRSANASFEKLEPRQLMSAAIRSVDGTGNNLSHVQWGSTDEQLIRLAPSQYADGKSTPAGKSRPSARAISNAVVGQGSVETPSATHLSAYAYLWGQFVDHDLDLTNSATPAESMNIAVPKGDVYFDPKSTGTQTIGFTRSKYASGTGVNSPRQQVTDITSFLDGSMIYGSDATRAKALRTLVGGKMKTSAGNLLPYNTMGLDNATLGGPASDYFVAGDVRANENIELTALQTLFVREHNRLAGLIVKQNPTWTDEQIYQQARKLVIAEVQAITYNEYLPALLGPNAIKPYSGYKPNISPGISTEFSTAAFRLGHSMVEDDVEFLDNNGNEVSDSVSLANAFFNPALVKTLGIDSMLKYLASTNSQEIDNKIVDSLRNFLFGPPGSGGFDLASLNIQRGRDHGLADYNTTRAAVGLPKVTSFAQITSDVTLQNQLKSLYGSVDNIDLWVGGLAENHAPGSNVGATFQRIIADQFTRTRDGDRFWYQNYLTPAEMQMVGNVKLSDIIARDSGITNLQPNVFVFNVEITGRVWNDRNGDKHYSPGEPGLAGRVVDLIDDSGAVVESVTTDRTGGYHFGELDLGTYQVRPRGVTGWLTTTPASQSLAATRGIRFANVDFGQRPIGAPVLPPPPPRPMGQTIAASNRSNLKPGSGKVIDQVNLV